MKNLLGIALLAGAGIYLFGSKKYNQYSDVVNNLDIEFLGVKNIGVSTSGITFKSKVKLTNPTATPLDVSTGGLVKIKRILFFNQSGEYLGEAEPNLSAVSIPANNSIYIEDIPSSVQIKNLGSLFNNAISIFQDPEKLKTKIEIEAFGQTKTING